MSDPCSLAGLHQDGEITATLLTLDRNEEEKIHLENSQHL